MTAGSDRIVLGKEAAHRRRFSSRASLRYIARRLSQAILVMLIVVIGNFILLKLAPGDLIDVLGGHSDLTAEQMATLRQMYGLDKSLPVQLMYYLENLARFDLGYSPKNAAPVFDVIANRIPITALLVFFSVAISLVFGTLLGVLAARRAGSPVDLIVSTTSLFFYATPSFIVAIGMILVFSVFFNLLPSAGYASVGLDLRGIAYVADVARHLTMPVMALCAFYVAIYSRLARATMLELLSHDFVRTARAKGLTERRIIYVHTLRNALLPLVTMAGLQVSSLIGGAVLIETVFGLPGMGRTAFDAVFERDVNLLLGVLFVSSLSVVCVNLVVDLLYLALDPRVELT